MNEKQKQKQTKPKEGKRRSGMSNKHMLVNEVLKRIGHTKLLIYYIILLAEIIEKEVFSGVHALKSQIFFCLFTLHQSPTIYDSYVRTSLEAVDH